MTISYDTLGGSINIEPSGVVTADNLNRSVAIVGSADLSNGAATAGEPALVRNSTDAVTQFGAGSELAIQAALALANGASDVYGVPTPTTDGSESVTAQSSGTLSAAPLSDPRFTTETVTVTNSGGTDLIVEYTDSTPTPPSADETVELNPTTGEWEADASGDYDFSYATPTFADAIEVAVGKTVRTVGVCAEASSVVSDLKSTLQTRASDFRFSRGVYGVSERVDPVDVSSYAPNEDDFRLVEVAPTYGTTTNGDKARLCGAIAGLAAAQPIDVTGSITYDEVEGFASLSVEYTPSKAQQFERLTALTDTMEVAEGVTTASDDAFSDIYKAEIIDYTVEQLHDRVTDYRGGSNAQSSRQKFRSRLKRTLSALSAPNAQPPLLAGGEGNRPYALDVGIGENDTETDVSIGIDPAPIAKQVNINVNVGPLQFEGVDVSE